MFIARHIAAKRIFDVVRQGYVRLLCGLLYELGFL